MSKLFPVPTKAGTYFVRLACDKPNSYAFEWMHVAVITGAAPCLRLAKIIRIDNKLDRTEDDVESDNNRHDALVHSFNTYRLDNIDFGPEFVAPPRSIRPEEVATYNNQSKQ